MSKDMKSCLESPPGCGSSGSGQHLPAPGTSWATSGQDEDELDDSLLELSDGEEDDSPFSYTEEEIQELLKDDDDLNDQSFLGGGLKNASNGGQMEKLGRDSCVSLDSPQDINSPCSLELGAGPASILQLPQVSTTASYSLTPTKLSSRPSAPEKNLLKVTTIPPFKSIIWKGALGKDKMESSKYACRNADCFGRPSHQGEDGSKDGTSHNNSKSLNGHEETTSASSIWEGPLSPSKGSPQQIVYGTKMPCHDVPTPLISLTLEQTGSFSNGKSYLGNRRHKIIGASHSPAIPSSSSKCIFPVKDSGKMVAHETRVSKITPLLPTRARSKYPRFSQAEPEPKMQISLKNRVTRVPKPRALQQGSLGELYALMDQVTGEEYQIRNRRWQHLSALTMLNYPPFRQKPLQRYSLT
ncbi:S100P-binding protein-like [Macrotis lagotis]|uniref:S100P-binding protein-like n=1 Tax=Macrotis lagotis TaxID=92651 RepID=UPI003D687066